MKSTDNLKAAFAGESQANRKYTAFAAKAESDGLPGVAKLFRAAAAAETVHALSHFRVLGGTKTTVENLQAAIEGEHYEVATMYPEFLATAQAEKNADAERTFKLALDVEKVHEALYRKALEAVNGGQDLAVKTFYVCEVCGHTVADSAPDKCPVCHAAGVKFKEVK